jgi:hypothetical protein
MIDRDTQIETLREGWLDQAARDAAEIVRLELEIVALRQKLFEADVFAGKQQVEIDRLRHELEGKS